MTKAMLAITVRAFKIHMNRGKSFDEIASSYPKLTKLDIKAIKDALGLK